MKRIQYLIPLLMILVILGGCSVVLNQLMAPFQPSFLPELSQSGNSILIQIKNESPMTESQYYTKYGRGIGDSGYNDYEILYAYYIFRSEHSPYREFQLPVRIYNPVAATIHYGKETKKQTSNYTYIVGTSSPYTEYEVWEDYLITSITTQDLRLSNGFYDGVDNVIAIEAQNTYTDTNVCNSMSYYYRIAHLRFYHDEDNDGYTLQTITKKSVLDMTVIGSITNKDYGEVTYETNTSFRYGWTIRNTVKVYARSGWSEWVMR